MEIKITGTSEEITALVLALQERQYESLIACELSKNIIHFQNEQDPAFQ